MSRRAHSQYYTSETEMTTELRIRVVGDGWPKGAICGKHSCSGYMGEWQRAGLDAWVLLQEGYRPKRGAYRLHRKAQRRYDLGAKPRDARGRWTGGIPDNVPDDPNAPNSYQWGVGPNAGPIRHGKAGLAEVPRERLPYRQRAHDGEKVECPRCHSLSVVVAEEYLEAYLKIVALGLDTSERPGLP